MNEAVSRQTRETLGQVIRKPPLTDALLSKPPFRYLHDLISEVIRVTGFLKGLYTDFELKSDNVKDKDSKINFLQKAIDAVVMVTGEPLSVKPARVVAGHEPEKTNEFLQAIGKCCLNKLSSDAAVKRVLAGEKADVKGKPPPSKPRDKESREPKAEEQKTHRNKESRRDTEVKDRSPSRDRKPKGDLKESREREKEKDKKKNNEEKHKEPERETSKEGQKQERERSKSRTAKQGREIEKNKGKGDPELRNDSGQDKGQEREKRHEEGREKDRLKGRDKNRDREGEKDRERGRDRDREKDGEHFREHGKEKAEKKPSDSEESVLRKPQRPTKDSKCQPDTEIETPARISEQPSAKGSRHRSKPGGEGAVDTRTVADGISEDGAAELQEKNEPGLPEKLKVEREVENVAPEKPENGEAPPDVPPQPAQRRTPRPGSARPAPPRVKRQESTELLIPERSGSAKTTPNVIREQQVSDEEDEQFVVESAVPLPEMLKEPEVELLEDQKHGGLVKRILETKKDYEASQKSSQITDREKPVVLEASRKKERDLVAKEIEKFQVSIQTVCQNAFRLGRIVDYIQEDMDAMRNELHTWRQENRQHAEALQREQSITDSAVEPLKADLAELEQLIKDQQDKICAVKANILRNEEKIQRMVLSINLSSRR
ncbi:TRAF3-interacting protein 1 isoform X3 [Oenanthe melanoleuca]|uniref:TRAF3-interacting protein 1 isoform X3 n=1 Tax=Oenanthe melanoleuca TaxID=2939378 RepID=UPI0024C0F34F|nr:TRAF3-interacting protein 1 isoform X3 [Oenanthe melanoleuca]